MGVRIREREKQGVTTVERVIIKNNKQSSRGRRENRKEVEEEDKSK